MAKLQSFSILVALCFISDGAFVISAQAEKTTTFLVEGKVYCDTCRAGFETTITQYIEGAKVQFQCRNTTTHEILHNVDGVTDKTGTYHIEITHNHEDEICEVTLLSSPDKNCSEIKGGRDRARVGITDNSGISSNVRYANSLGFLKSEPLEICGALLAQYALGDEE